MFADFAEACQERGFPGFKLHTWFPPSTGTGSGTPPYPDEPVDPADDDGHVPVPQRPGLGYDIDREYVHDNRVEG